MQETRTERTGEASATGDMPRAVRLALWVVTGLLFGGAVYLIAVRGEALLVDLSAMAGRIFCL